MTRTESNAVVSPNDPSPPSGSSDASSPRPATAASDPALDALAARIGAAREQTAEKSTKPPHGAEVGFQMALELLSGVAVGGFGGYQLDVWLGTKPWLMLVCLLFGMGIGMYTMLRTAKRYY